VAEKRKQAPDLLEAAFAEIAQSGLGGFSRAALARRAGVDLGEVYRTFPTRMSLLRRLGERLDAAMLELDLGELEEMSPRERLFELIMRRFDAMKPYRAGLLRLSRELLPEPRLLLRSALNLDRLVEWLLELADIPPRGCARLFLEPALAAAYLRSYRVWLRDESPDQAKTLAALDRELARFERLASRFLRGAMPPRRPPREPESAAQPA